MCAVDALGIPAMLGTDAVITSVDSVCCGYLRFLAGRATAGQIFGELLAGIT
jgi:hypothetical protein